MDKFPIIMNYNPLQLANVVAQFSRVSLIAQESRRNFTAVFPLHNRYFSNGDKPLVALVKKSGYACLTYAGLDHVLGDEEAVFFDDNVPHSWVMKNCDLEIFYYRQAQGNYTPVCEGNFCLDSYFA
ncbi:MAG: hypothetical protein BWZ03_00321 [bacterium ADurb.BinA186]|nr:MAG: hypothetical protein BWZ03_00321 [bacterium ADurb.BinA186]